MITSKQILDKVLPWLKTFWWVVAAGIVAIVLWHGCKAGPDHSGDKAEIDSVVHVYTMAKQVDLNIIKGLVSQDSAKDKEIDQLRADKLNMQRDLSDRGKAIDQTIKTGQQARVDKDTAAIVSNCDSLIVEVEAGKQLVGGYEVLTDSLIKDETAQIAIKDALISNWKGLFMKCDTTQATLFSKYNSLYTDYQKVNKRLKFSGVMGKIGAVTIAALVTGLLIKK